MMDTRNGMEIHIGGARNILLQVSNDGPSTATIVVRGGDRTVRIAGNGEDECVQIASMESRYIGPLDAGEFVQPGGFLWLDFTLETVGRISAYRVD
jgi:hypothetical protein